MGESESSSVEIKPRESTSVVSDGAYPWCRTWTLHDLRREFFYLNAPVQIGHVNAGKFVRSAENNGDIRQACAGIGIAALRVKNRC